MPRTSYNVVPSARRDGQPLGPRDSLDFAIPKLAQIATITIADASPAAAEAWQIVATDDETGQQFTLDFLSGASLAATLDNAVAAVAADGKFNDLFVATEDGATILTLTARHVGRGYSFAVTPGGSATATPAITQVAGGDKIAFARMLAVAAGGEAREMGSGDTARDMAGITFRTDMNHTRPYEPADQRAGFDGLDRGDTVSLMREGVLCVVPEAAPSALDDSVYVRISGSGDVGVLTATADGGNTVDISDFARWLRLADGDGVAEVRVNLF